MTSYEISVTRICIEFALALFLSTYLIILSIMSPCPPFADSFLGPFLNVFSWVFSNALFIRTRCTSAARLERYGTRSLSILGLMTQLGQLFGGILVFVLVNFANVFKSAPQCGFDRNLYCN